MPNAATILQFPVQTTISIPPSISLVSPSGMFRPDEERLTSSGRPKAKEAEPFHSYADYKRMSNFFLSNGKIRDYALLTIGIATGLRISDLVSLRFGHLIVADEKGRPVFRDSLDIKEIKTGKSTKSRDDSVLITEAVREATTALIKYYQKKNININMDTWLFQSKQPNRNEYVEDDDGTLVPNPLYGEHVISATSVHRIFKDAERKLGFTYNIGTHSMRKTFASLAYIIARRKTENVSAALEQVQTLMRHANQKTTNRYLKITYNESNAIRHAISDFLLGKSDIEAIDIS